MHIVVCMKQVPRDNSVKINPDLSINAEGIEQIMNLFDEYAVEEALQWNEKLGGKVTILSLGPEAWKEQIRRALAMGATDALLLSDLTGGSPLGGIQLGKVIHGSKCIVGLSCNLHRTLPFSEYKVGILWLYISVFEPVLSYK